MKYILLIVIIFLLSSCTYQKENTHYDYLPDNSLRFIRTDNNTSILISKEDKYYLLLLNEENVNIKVDYLIKYKDVKTSMEATYKFFLTEDINIDDITFKVNDKIEVLMDNNNICVYIKELDRDNYKDCNYIYLYNPDKDFYITLNSSLSVLIYPSYTKFNYKFMHHLSTVWIDSYTIDTSSYLTLTLYDNDFKITSGKIKENTIHIK